MRYLFLSFFVLVQIAQAQNADSTTATKTATAVTTHVGLVSMSGYNFKTDKVEKFASLRVGGRMVHTLAPGLEADIWSTLDAPSGLVIFQGLLKISGKNWTTVGYGATVGTYLRPFPLTLDGQFEFTAESMPPGGALGVTTNLNGPAAGLYVRDKKAEIQLGYLGKKASSAVWYTPETSVWGASATGTLGGLWTIASYQAKKLGIGLGYQNTGGYMAAVDIAIKNSKLEGLFLGVQKNFMEMKFRAGVGGDLVKGTVSVYSLFKLK